MNRLVPCICLVFCFLVGSLVGCKAGGPEFTRVVMDHSKVTSETAVALLASIDDELSNPGVSGEYKQKLSDLRYRLEYMKESAQVIEQYQLALYADKELLARLYKNILTK